MACNSLSAYVENKVNKGLDNLTSVSPSNLESGRRSNPSGLVEAKLAIRLTVINISILNLWRSARGLLLFHFISLSAIMIWQLSLAATYSLRRLGIHLTFTYPDTSVSFHYLPSSSSHSLPVNTSLFLLTTFFL